MKKLFVLSHHPIKPGAKGFTRQDLEASLDLTRSVEEEIRFDMSSFYEADSPEDRVEKSKLSIYGANWPVSAREFTDEEYRKIFETSPHRKIEWLGEALGIGIVQSRAFFEKLSNKRLNELVASLAGKTIPPVSYR